MKISEHTSCTPPPVLTKKNRSFFQKSKKKICASCVQIPFCQLTETTNISRCSRLNLKSIGRFWRKLEQFFSQFFPKKRSKTGGGVKSRNRHDTPVLSQHDHSIMISFSKTEFLAKVRHLNFLIDCK